MIWRLAATRQGSAGGVAGKRTNALPWRVAAKRAVLVDDNLPASSEQSFA
ncbi:MAG TPA: hypothetical protein VGY66_12530 [Gemmataceae bacterium]|nr:hypothetical protein [Gemmataceae bacterium]